MEHSKNSANHIYFLYSMVVAILLLTALPVLAAKVATPVFNILSGRYHHPLSITLKCATPGVSIYYTTNGATPDSNSTFYNGAPILVANHASGDSLTGSTDNDPAPDDSSQALTYISMTIKAIAIKPGMEQSDVAAAQYVLDLVDGSFNIAYADPPPAGGGKHLLDVYQPHGKTNTPVVLFIHGGAWKQGDKNMYLELGNTLAGYYNATTVIASYQLSTNPWNAIHPTHVKDVAMAFAWVHGHIRAYGGDSTNISVFGQSAGGHLVSLMATDSTYLDSLGQSVQSIKRVISMSGTYDLYAMVKWPLNPLNLTAQEVLEYKALCVNTFGSYDKEVLDAASPIKHLSQNQPPFYLITLNQTNDFKDMPGFPKEAQNFYDAVLALNGPSVHLDILNKEDIPPEIYALDFPGDTDGHYQEIYAINTRNWDSRSSKMVAGYLDLQPETPLPAHPENGASTTTETTVIWHQSREASYYHLQVSDASSFADPDIIFDAFIADTAWTLSNLVPNKDYFWRVSAISAAGESEFSSAQSFKTSGAAGVQTDENLSHPHDWKLSLYPNPFNGAVRITVKASLTKSKGKIMIFNLLGRKVLERNVAVNTGENSFTWFPESVVPSGIYLIRFDFGRIQFGGKVLYLK